jgi:RimJ/RimL family protein N-acetyltransferase
MIRIASLEKKDASCIVGWNNGKDADFLTQWAGRGYRYPLTLEQITERLGSNDAMDYKIFGIWTAESIIGTVELLKIDLIANRAVIGHFLIDPAQTGKGYGTEALQLLVNRVFAEMPLNTLELTVFDFNRPAIRCYQKAGFIKTNEVMRPNGWIAINMEIRRKDS